MDIGNLWLIIADITTLGHEDVSCPQKAKISIAIFFLSAIVSHYKHHGTGFSR